MQSKKGLSVIIATLLLVFLSILAVALVWTISQGLIKDQTANAKACFDALGKISFNDQETCYTGSEEDVATVQFSINMGDAWIDGAVIEIADGIEHTKLEINTTISTIENLILYSGSPNIIIPPENSGLTYVFDMDAAGFTLVPELRLTPKINTTLCETADTATNLPLCVS